MDELYHDILYAAENTGHFKEMYDAVEGLQSAYELGCQFIVSSEPGKPVFKILPLEKSFTLGKKDADLGELAKLLYLSSDLESLNLMLEKADRNYMIILPYNGKKQLNIIKLPKGVPVIKLWFHKNLGMDLYVPSAKGMSIYHEPLDLYLGGKSGRPKLEEIIKPKHIPGGY